MEPSSNTSASSNSNNDANSAENNSSNNNNNMNNNSNSCHKRKFNEIDLEEIEIEESPLSQTKIPKYSSCVLSDKLLSEFTFESFPDMDSPPRSPNYPFSPVNELVI